MHTAIRTIRDEIALHTARLEQYERQHAQLVKDVAQRTEQWGARVAGVFLTYKGLTLSGLRYKIDVVRSTILYDAEFVDAVTDFDVALANDTLLSMVHVDIRDWPLLRGESLAGVVKNDPGVMTVIKGGDLL